MLCYAMLCYAMLWHDMICHDIVPYYTMSCHVMPCTTIPCDITSRAARTASPSRHIALSAATAATGLDDLQAHRPHQRYELLVASQVIMIINIILTLILIMIILLIIKLLLACLLRGGWRLGDDSDPLPFVVFCRIVEE